VSAVPSHYQQAIIDHVVACYQARRRGRAYRNLVVQATAGSGKSSALRMVCEALAPLGARVDVVSFNSRVARDASARLPSCARSITLHAAGKRAWEGLCGRRFVEATKAREGDGELAKDKTARIVAKLKTTGAVDRYVPAGQIGKLVSRAKGCGLVPLTNTRDPETGEVVRGPVRAGIAAPVELVPLAADTDAVWRELIGLCEISTQAPGPLIAAARAVLAKSVESSQAIIDFDDMVYLPALCPAVSFEVRDVVMVDEAQDLDSMQRSMVVKMVQSSGLPSIGVCVGDRRQAIYSWRGADIDSLDRLKSDLDAEELPLHRCYRCPTSHIELARAVAPEIEAAPGAIEGEVVEYDQGVLYEVATGRRVDDEGAEGVQGELETRYFPRSRDFEPGDAVICRMNAPLVRLAYALLRARVPFKMLGKDFGRGVVDLVGTTRAQGAADAIGVLRGRLDRLEADDRKARAAGQLDDGPSPATAALRERVEVLQAVLETMDCAPGEDPGSDALCRELESLFSKEEDGVTLATIHGAKGGEWERVWVLDSDLLKVKPGANPKRSAELSNLKFVSLTRSRRSMFFISSQNMP
jgi:DNA helicase-2/ATP-dependent DNA helicase PcrA